MKFAAFRRTLAAVAGTALVSSALLVTASAPVPAAATQPAGSAPAAAQPVLVDCVGHAKVEPSRQVLACADGADVLMKLNWSHWGAQALATGSEAINDCTPTCVGGTFHKFPPAAAPLRPDDVHPGHDHLHRHGPGRLAPHPHRPAVRLASQPPAEPASEHC